MDRLVMNIAVGMHPSEILFRPQIVVHMGRIAQRRWISKVSQGGTVRTESCTNAPSPSTDVLGRRSPVPISDDHPEGISKGLVQRPRLISIDHLGSGFDYTVGEFVRDDVKEASHANQPTIPIACLTIPHSFIPPASIDPFRRWLVLGARTVDDRLKLHTMVVNSVSLKNSLVEILNQGAVTMSGDRSAIFIAESSRPISDWISRRRCVIDISEFKVESTHPPQWVVKREAFGYLGTIKLDQIAVLVDTFAFTGDGYRRTCAKVIKHFACMGVNQIIDALSAGSKVGADPMAGSCISHIHTGFTRKCRHLPDAPCQMPPVRCLLVEKLQRWLWQRYH